MHHQQTSTVILYTEALLALALELSLVLSSSTCAIVYPGHVGLQQVGELVYA